MTSLPVVDFSLIGTEKEAQLAHDWGEALKSHGYVLVRNYSQGVKREVHDLERKVRKFFCEQSQAEKSGFQLTANYSKGYGSPGQIAVSRASSIRHRNPDAVETITFPCLTPDVERAADAVIPNPTAAFTGQVKYNDGSELRNAFVRYYHMAQEELMVKALHLTALYFRLPAHVAHAAGGVDMPGPCYFRSTSAGFYSSSSSNADDSKASLNCFGRIAVNHYLPRFLDNQMPYGEHTDTSMFTFVWRSGINGLQFLTGDNWRGTTTVLSTKDDEQSEQWADIPHDPELIVVNIGDSAERMTNGVWKAVVHRVSGPPPDELGKTLPPELQPITISFFAQPHNDSPLSPLPSPLIDPEVKKEYLPVLTAGGLREFKVGNMKMPQQSKM